MLREIDGFRGSFREAGVRGERFGKEVGEATEDVEVRVVGGAIGGRESELGVLGVVEQAKR